MNQSTFGSVFRVTTWGESHGPAVGAVVEGCPAGLSLSEEIIQRQLDRRRPGRSRYTTARKESDAVEILSGVFEGKTTGTPVGLLIRNQDAHSADYSDIAKIYRPGHADFCYDAKYGFRDYRGGGRSSGRETAARVAAGAVAMALLSRLDISITAFTKAVGPVRAESFDPDEISRNPLCMPDAAAAVRAQEWLEKCIAAGDSSGGVIECRISGVPAGLGDPVFGKLDAVLAGAMMSIGAVKAVEIGDGMAVSGLTGSQDNDGFSAAVSSCAENGTKEVRFSKTSNHAGGILGGISDGSDIILRVSIKPTPSISMPQETADKDGGNVTAVIRGRHDPVIVPRAVVVVESMAALSLADALLFNMHARMENVMAFYRQETKKPVVSPANML